MYFPLVHRATTSVDCDVIVCHVDTTSLKRTNTLVPRYGIRNFKAGYASKSDQSVKLRKCEPGTRSDGGKIAFGQQ